MIKYFVQGRRTIVGIALIIMGVVCNEKTIALLFTGDGSIDILFARIVLWTFDICCIILGLVIMLNVTDRVFQELIRMKYLLIPFNLLHKNLCVLITNRPYMVLMVLLISCLSSILAFPLIRGISSPYYEYGDRDVYSAFEQLFLNSGMSHDFHAHDGYLYKTFFAFWIFIHDFLSVNIVANMNLFCEQVSLKGFGATITPIIISGRVFTIMLSVLFIAVFVYGLYLFCNNWGFAILGGLLLSSTGSFKLHTVVMKPGLLSALFLMLAVFAVLLYTKERNASDPIYLFLIGLFSMLSVMGRNISISGILLLPVLFIYFSYSNKVSNEKLEYYKIYYKEFFIISLIISIPFLMHYLSFFWQNDTFQLGVNADYIAKFGAYRYVGDRLIYYAVFVYLLIMILIYNYLIVKSINQTVIHSFLIISGIASAYYLHMIHYDERSFAPIIFFYDYLINQMEYRGEGNIFYVVMMSGFSVFYSKINPLSYMAYPFMFFQAFVFIVVIICIYNKDYRKNAIQALALILCAWILEIFFRMRAFSEWNLYNPAAVPYIYRIWVDFFYIISLITVLSIKHKGRPILERVYLYAAQDRFLPKLRNLSSFIITLCVLVNTADSYHKIHLNDGKPYRTQPVSIVVNPVTAGFFPLIYEFIVNDSGGACREDVYDYTQECEEYLLRGLITDQ